MKISMKVLLTSFCMMLACGATLLQTASAADALSPGRVGILGHMDPKTGAFRPVSPSDQNIEETDMLATTIGGKFIFNFTITLSSPISTSTPIICTANASIMEISASYTTIADYIETVSAAATRSSATAARCSVAIPYSWLLQSPTTDFVTLGYSVATTGTVYPQRSSSSHAMAIKLPANGIITTKAFNVTL